jgi:hypothetical protein
MTDLHPSNEERQAMMRALYTRVGDHTADEKTTVVDYLWRDLGWELPLFEATLESLVKGGLITVPTEAGTIGLTRLGLAVALRRSQEGAAAAEDDEDG